MKSLFAVDRFVRYSASSMCLSSVDLVDFLGISNECRVAFIYVKITCGAWRNKKKIEYLKLVHIPKMIQNTSRDSFAPFVMLNSRFRKFVLCVVFSN